MLLEEQADPRLTGEAQDQLSGESPAVSSNFSGHFPRAGEAAAAMTCLGQGQVSFLTMSV